MKDFNTLTKEQIVALSDAEVLEYAKIQMVKDGKALPVPPTTEAPPVVVDYDLTYVSFTDFVVDVETADKIRAILDNSVVYNKPYGSQSYRVVGKDDYAYPRIQLESAMSPANQMKYEQEKAKISSQAQEYKEQEEAYNKALSELDEVVGGIWAVINDELYNVRRKEYLTKAWEEYLSLAQDNKEVAEAFFLRSYSKKELDIVKGE